MYVVYMNLCIYLCATIVTRCTLPRLTSSPKQQQQANNKKRTKKKQANKIVPNGTELRSTHAVQKKKKLNAHTHIYNIAVLGCQHLTVN